MAGNPIEVILLRQLAATLATPIFIIDPEGTLVFYNEPAELILGKRFDEVGELTSEELGQFFRPADRHGKPLPLDAVPVIRALVTGAPAHDELWIEGADGVRRHIEATAFPIVGIAKRQLGAVAVFWEKPLQS